MNNKIILKLSLLLLLLTVAACKKEDCCNNFGAYSQGIFVVNEGPFGNGTGSITFNYPGIKTEQDIFNKVNKRPLGNVVQSMAFHGSNAYIVVNNAAKVEVVDAQTFVSTGVINGLAQPRYFLGVNAFKAYVSQWGADGVSGSIEVIDLSSLTVTKSIPLGGGPERMLLYNKKVYVANSGGFGKSDELYVIDTSSDTVEKTLHVGDNPNSLAIDGNTLWVLCGGYADWVDPSNSTNGSLHSYNIATGALVSNIALANNGAKDLTKADNGLYFNFDGSIYNLPSNAGTVNVFATRNSYGLGYNNGQLYATDAKDYSSNGMVYIYNTNAAVTIDSFETGVIPNGVYFQ